MGPCNNQARKFVKGIKMHGDMNIFGIKNLFELFENAYCINMKLINLVLDYLAH